MCVNKRSEVDANHLNMSEIVAAASAAAAPAPAAAAATAAPAAAKKGKKSTTPEGNSPFAVSFSCQFIFQYWKVLDSGVSSPTLKWAFWVFPTLAKGSLPHFFHLKVHKVLLLIVWQLPL